MVKRRPPRSPRKRAANRPLLLRLQHLCDIRFGGNVGAFARAVCVHRAVMYDILRDNHAPQMDFVRRVLSAGVVNAEWLLCGTGPMQPVAPVEVGEAFTVPDVITAAHPHFLTDAVQYEEPRKARVPSTPRAVVQDGDLLYARMIHAARSADKPVVVFLGETAVRDNAGVTVIKMLERGYVTGVALSSAAAMRDFERAAFGGVASHSDRLQRFVDLNQAALRAARLGAGYGEIVGRWCFPADTQRDQSVLAQAYDLGLPATIHVALGDSAHHFFPAKFGAELGAALGAASYVDMLIFAQLVQQMAGTPSGVFLAADDNAQSPRLFANALAAVESDEKTSVNDSTLIVIGRDYRLTFPALLAACDAVYDGSADDGRRMRSKQRT